MQINRPNVLNSPPLGPQSIATKSPITTPTPARPEPVAPKESGVTFTGSADLNSMTLENQLEYGRNQGVFTKITLHKEGVLVTTPHREYSAGSNGFVASAVSTMKDFEEGVALLNQHAPESNTKTMDFLAGKLRGLQSVASKLNVFA